MLRSVADLILTDARLCEELECLLGAREEIPLMVSLLRVLGLIICRPVNWPVQKNKCTVLNVTLLSNLSFLSLSAHLSLMTRVSLSSSAPQVSQQSSGLPSPLWPASFSSLASWADEQWEPEPHCPALWQTTPSLGSASASAERRWTEREKAITCYQYKQLSDRILGSVLQLKCSLYWCKECLPAQRWNRETQVSLPRSWPTLERWTSLLVVSSTYYKSEMPSGHCSSDLSHIHPEKGLLFGLRSASSGLSDEPPAIIHALAPDCSCLWQFLLSPCRQIRNEYWGMIWMYKPTS